MVPQAILVSDWSIFKTSSQEMSVVAMFANESGRNYHSL
jgi:hypothetical protein